MNWQILKLVYPLIIFMVALFCYKQQVRPMTWFCMRMTYRDIVRRNYCAFLTLLVLIWLYISLHAGGKPYEMLPTLILTPLMVYHRLAEHIFYWMKRPRRMVIYFVIVMVCLIVPHMFTTAVSLAIIMVGALFYPSHRVRLMAPMPEFIVSLMRSQETIHKYYY